MPMRSPAAFTTGSRRMWCAFMVVACAGLPFQDRADVLVVAARQLGDSLLGAAAVRVVPAAESQVADAIRGRQLDGFDAFSRDGQQPAVPPADDRNPVGGAALHRGQDRSDMRPGGQDCAFHGLTGQRQSFQQAELATSEYRDPVAKPILAVGCHQLLDRVPVRAG
jgi:hypothetical protein